MRSMMWFTLCSFLFSFSAFAGTLNPDIFLQSIGVRAAGFSAEERAQIAEGLSRLPICWQGKLRGLRFVRSAELDGPAEDCTEGYYPGDGSILLYPRCNFGAHIVVHETFHHLGRLAPLFLNQRWKDAVLTQYPRCPVSEYGAEGLGSNNEDLAEAGRILLVPESGDRNTAECVNAKLRVLAQLLRACR